MTRIDIHGFEKRFINAKKLLLKCETMTTKEKQLITEFSEKNIADSLSIARATKYILYLTVLSKFFKKPLLRISTKDIISLFSKLNTGEIKSRNGKAYAPNTIEDFKKTLRKFYNFLGRPELVDKTVIRYKKVATNVRASDIWTEEEMQKLLNSCSDIQTRAWLSLTIELGNRIGEAGNIHIGDIEIADNDVFVKLDGKTGQRSLLLLVSAADVLNWLDNHPLKDDKNAPFFIITRNMTVSENGIKRKIPSIRPMSYTMFMKRLYTVFIKSGVKKPFNSHIFRHSVTVMLLKKNYNTELIKKRQGWSPSSKVMAETYSHWTNQDIVDAEKKMRGVSCEKIEIKEARRCPRCKIVNVEGVDFCKRCGSPLSVEVAMKMADTPRIERYVEELVIKEMERLRRLKSSL